MKYLYRNSVVLLPVFLVVVLWATSCFRPITVGINLFKKCYLLGMIQSGNLSLEISTGTIAKVSPFFRFESTPYTEDTRQTVRQTLTGSALQFENVGGYTGNLWIISIPIWPIFVGTVFIPAFSAIRSRTEQDSAEQPAATPKSTAE